MKSHGGVIVMWAGAPLAWLSQRQPLITLSSAEAELVEGIEGHLFSLNVETLLADLQCKVQRQLMLDNTSAISLATTQDKSCSWRTRHLRLRALALREQLLLGTVQVRFCPGNEQLALSSVCQKKILGLALTASKIQQKLSLIINANSCHQGTLFQSQLKLLKSMVTGKSVPALVCINTIRNQI